MNAVFTIDGLPELNARLDKIAVVVANPITREALAAGGKVIKDKSRGAGALRSRIGRWNRPLGTSTLVFSITPKTPSKTI